MLVYRRFDGDDVDLAWNQHAVYWEALGIIVGRCNALTRFAIRLLEDTAHSEWGTASSSDHRCLQGAHDILAAAWRYEVLPPLQRRLPLTPDMAEEPTAERWLEWLAAETNRWDGEPALVRCVQVILANENEPLGYEAESRLEGLLTEWFCHIPWR